jgi:predicted transcriptional regulator with HTH domain
MLIQQAGDYLHFFGLPELARTVMADPSDLRAALAAR